MSEPSTGRSRLFRLFHLFRRFPRSRRGLLTVALAPALVLVFLVFTASSAPTVSAALAIAPAPQDEPVDAATDAAPDARQLGITPESAERQAELVRGEDARLVDIRVAETGRPAAQRTQPFRIRSAGLYTLVLTPRRNAYTLDDLRVLAPQTFLLQRDGSYLLREHLLVEAGATLALTPQGPTTIKLSSGAEGFVSIVTRGGRLRLLGTAAAPLTIQSWDTTAGRPDTKLDDGRAYMLSIGQLIARHVSFGQLGFWSGRTGGVAMVGSALQVLPVDPTAAKTRAAGSSSSRRQTSVLPTGALPGTEGSAETSPGEVSDSRMDRNAFGLYVSGAAGAKISHLTISGSLVSGLVLHRGISSAQVESVTVSGSGLDGIVVARGVEGTVVTQSSSRGNGRDGVVVSGVPLAAGPSPSGASTRPFGSNVLSTSDVTGNRRSGVRIVGGTNVRLMGNVVTGGIQGILVAHGATKVVVDGNRVTDVTANGIQVRESTGVEITGNTVRRVATGLHLADATVTVRDNTVDGATLHALTFVGDVRSSVARDNALGGSGTSAIDLTRSAAERGPALEANDTSRWQRKVTKDTLQSTLSHPMTVLWLLIGLTLVTTRRAPRRMPGGSKPYLDSPPLPASALVIEADQGAALVAVGAPVGASVAASPTPVPLAHNGQPPGPAPQDPGDPGRCHQPPSDAAPGYGPRDRLSVRAAHRHGRADGAVDPVMAQVAEAGPGLFGVEVAPDPGELTADWLRQVGAL